MTTPATVINKGEATSLTNIVREAHRLGIDVPKDVDLELDLHDRLTRQDPLSTQHALQQAYQAVQSAPSTKIDAALNALTEASLKTLAAQGLADTLSTVALNRLRGAVYDALPAFEAEVVEKFNDAVDRHHLNDVAGDLPDLTTVISPIDLAPAQSHAIDVWRSGVAELHPLFGLYRRIAEVHSDEVGPADDALGVNLLLAARLGPVPSFSVAESAAVAFTSIAAGTDAARRYRELAPFVVVGLAGYPLELATTAEATRRRRAIQPAHA